MKITLIIIIISFSFCGQTPKQKESLSNSLSKPKLIIPKRKSLDSLTRVIDWGVKEGGLGKLRETVLPKNDLEIRIWFVSFARQSGLVIKKSDESWTATYIDSKYLGENQSPKTILIDPKSSWQNVWRKLTDAEILTLPDSSEIENYPGDMVRDGFSYIVEINKNQVYRIYEYANPNWGDSFEGKQMVKISKIIAEEFGLEEFYFDKDSETKLTKE